MELPRTHPEIQGKVETLIVLLREQLKCARRVAGLVRQRLLAEARGNLSAVEEGLDNEKEALLAHTLAERERIAILTEIGLILRVRQPSRLRLAQLIFYVSTELRDELLEIREELRDIADEMVGLRAWGSKFDHHCLGRVTLYVSPEVSEKKSKRWLIENMKELSTPCDLDPFDGALGHAEPSFREES